MFLSHVQSTGQKIASPIELTMKDAKYDVFLDVRAKFDLHNLEQLVSQTKVFCFIITDKIFESKWCYVGIKYFDLS